MFDQVSKLRVKGIPAAALGDTTTGDEGGESSLCPSGKVPDNVLPNNKTKMKLSRYSDFETCLAKTNLSLEIKYKKVCKYDLSRFKNSRKPIFIQ